MINKIQTIVLGLCDGQDWDWKNHIESVVRHSKELAARLGADSEVVEISAWLHDIKKLRGEKEMHHVKGAEEAAEILRKLGFPKEKIDAVKHCIITHSSDENYRPVTVEAKILASADAMSHIDNLASLERWLYNIEKLSKEECRKRLLVKIQKSWRKMMPEAREIVKDKYEVIIAGLSNA